MNVLVTGGAGFVGHNLAQHLAEQTDIGRVYVVDNLSSPSAKTRDNLSAKVHTFCIDLAQEKDSAIFTHKVDIIYHLAACARIQPSFDKPDYYFRNNLMSTLTVCQIAKKWDAVVVYASTSSKTHGKFCSPYTTSKMMCEDLLESYRTCFNVRCCVCTFYNVYGPGEPREGEYSTVVGRFLEQFEHGKPLTIVGSGKQRRDFTHVDDICDGLIKAADFTVDHGKYGMLEFHLGTGNTHSIRQLASYFPETMIMFVPLRRNEGLITQAEPGPTETTLGWHAKDVLEEYIKLVTGRKLT